MNRRTFLVLGAGAVVGVAVAQKDEVEGWLERRYRGLEGFFGRPYRGPNPPVSLGGNYGDGEATGLKERPKSSGKPEMDAEGWIYPDEVDRNPDGSYAYDFSDPVEVYRAFVEGVRNIGTGGVVDGKLFLSVLPEIAIIDNGFGIFVSYKNRLDKGVIEKDEEILRCRRLLDEFIIGRENPKPGVKLSNSDREKINEFVWKHGLLEIVRLQTGSYPHHRITDVAYAREVRRYKIVARTNDDVRLIQYKREVSKKAEQMLPIFEFLGKTINPISDVTALVIEEDDGECINSRSTYVYIKSSDGWKHHKRINNDFILTGVPKNREDLEKRHMEFLKASIKSEADPTRRRKIEELLKEQTGN